MLFKPPPQKSTHWGSFTHFEYKSVCYHTSKGGGVARMCALGGWVIIVCEGFI